MSDGLPPPRVDGRALDGRVAVVTGASRGIGAAIVRRLAGAGAAVVVAHHGYDDAAAALLAELRDAGAAAVAVATDVTSRADCEAVVARAVAEFGGLDILVNNAAVTDAHRRWTDITEDEWDLVMRVNARGPFSCVRAAHPWLRRSTAGRVVNISSVTFDLGQPGLLHYVASKGALVGLTRSLARELGPDRITVNAVAPGAIRTEMELELFAGQDDRIAHDQARRQAVERRGLPEDVAAAVVWLASEDAGFVTGQTVRVDGGWAMS